MKCGDEGEGSAGPGRFEHQLPGRGWHRGDAAGAVKGEGLLRDDDGAARG